MTLLASHRRAGHPSTDDVFVKHVGWGTGNYDAVAHRVAADGQSAACAAESTEGWQRISAYRSKQQLNSPCHLPQCFPTGWGW